MQARAAVAVVLLVKVVACIRLGVVATEIQIRNCCPDGKSNGQRVLRVGIVGIGRRGSPDKGVLKGVHHYIGIF